MDRFFTESISSKTPEEIIELFQRTSALNIKDLRNDLNCSQLNLGTLLDSGRNGKVFIVKEKNSEGLHVVVKTIEVVDKMSVFGDVVVMHSSLCEIIMSAYFHKYYNDEERFSAGFPYFDGFLTCGNKAHIVIEKLETTLNGYIYSRSFRAEIFTHLLFQIVFNLQIIRAEKIMHNDLHTRNLMIVYVDYSQYKGQDIDSVYAPHLFYQSENNYYQVPNSGYLVKFVDFDFACRHSAPKLCPGKLYNRALDKWNVNYKWSESYDLLTILIFIVVDLWIIFPLSPELSQARIFIATLIRKVNESIPKDKKPHLNKFFEDSMKKNRMRISPLETSYINDIMFFAGFFHTATHRLLPEFDGLVIKLPLDFWHGLAGIEKIDHGGVPLVGKF